MFIKLWLKKQAVSLANHAHAILFGHMANNGMILGANVLTALAADLYKSADIVGREIQGIITSSTLNGGSERAAVGQVVRSHFTRAVSATTVSPSMTIPEGTDQTVDNKTLTLTQTAAIQIPFTGEDIKYLNGGAGFNNVFRDQMTQAMREISNDIETYAWGLARAGASRAFGTAGTTPFASNFNEVAELRQILVDNGAPMSDNRGSLVVNTLAGTKLRNLAQLQKVNEAGGSDLLRQGELLNLQGLSLKESYAPVAVTKGTGASYLVNGALAVGATAIVVDTGSGTILAGDTITFAADTVNKYVVATALTGSTVTIAAPGLRVAIPDNNPITVGNTATANIALHRNALEVVMRPYAVPEGGDAATETMVVSDPWSGLSFNVSVYKGYKKMMVDISCVYDAKVWKPEFVVQLLG